MVKKNENSKGKNGRNLVYIITIVIESCLDFPYKYVMVSKWISI